MCFSCYPLFAFFAFFLLVLVPPPLVKTPLAAAAAGIARPPLFSNSGSTFAPASFSPPFFLCSFAMSLAHTLRQVTREASPGIDAVAKRHWSASTSEAAKSQIFMLPEDVVVPTRGCALPGWTAAPAQTQGALLAQWPDWSLAFRLASESATILYLVSAAEPHVHTFVRYVRLACVSARV